MYVCRRLKLFLEGSMDRKLGHELLRHQNQI